MRPMSRRSFLQVSARSAGGMVLGAAALTAASAARVQGAGDRIALALVGAGGRGRELALKFLKVENVEFKCVCDVEAEHAGYAVKEIEKAQGRAPAQVADLRQALDDKDVHGIVVATPEHWHALATVWGCQAGKDVYVEKNISMTPWEGRKMIEAAAKYKRIVQCGTQNRSAPYACTARDYLQSGKLGKVVLVKSYNMLGGVAWKPAADTDPPKGLDWDRWLGPAPKVPYNPGRHRGWGAWWDYGGGSLSGDASHTLDLVRLVLGDPPAPKSVCAAGGNLAFGSACEAPELQAITFEFDGFVVTMDNTAFPPYMKKTPPEIRYSDKFPAWRQNSTRIEIYGTELLMYVGRHGGGWQVFAADEKLVDQGTGYFPDKWHQPNFIECMRTRAKPNGDIEAGHASANLIHLANASYRVGNRKLLWDGREEKFTNCDEANALLAREHRAPYRIADAV